MSDFVLSRHCGLLLIVSGPAGSGKTTLCDRLLGEFAPELERVVTATTRPPRPGEVNGVDYHFLSHEEFLKGIDAGDFYEHARVHTNRYGVLRKAVVPKLEASVNLLLNVDVQGAASFRHATVEDPLLNGRTVSVFIMPRSIEQLHERLTGRGSDDEAEIARRMDTALKEVPLWTNYDYCIQSGTREEDYESIRSIFLAEQLRTSRLKS